MATGHHTDPVTPDRAAERVERRRGIATLATLAIHALLVAGLALNAKVSERTRDRQAPTIELVDIEIPPPPAPTPPPPAPTPPPPEVSKPLPSPRVPTRTVAPAHSLTTATPTPNPTPTPTAEPAPGGAPVVSLPNAPPSARGVAVRVAPANHGPVGKGGEGGGTGSGSGSGSGDKPLSVAMIKTPAQPKGDYSYFDARRDYPEEARRLGIEGKLRARLSVSAAGEVTAVVLLNRLGHGLDEVALAQAKKLEFVAAKDANDRPVPCFVVWTFTFTLPSST